MKNIIKRICLLLLIFSSLLGVVSCSDFKEYTAGALHFTLPKDMRKLSITEDVADFWYRNDDADVNAVICVDMRERILIEWEIPKDSKTDVIANTYMINSEIEYTVDYDEENDASILRYTDEGTGYFYVHYFLGAEEFVYHVAFFAKIEDEEKYSQKFEDWLTKVYLSE